MPYDRNSDLPPAVRNSLPAAAQGVFRNAVNGALDRGLSEQRAFMIGWGAVRNAGWRKPESGDGKWVKKQQPSEAETHVDAPTGERRRRRRKKPKEPETPDVSRETGVTYRAEDGEEVSLSIAITKTSEDERLVFGWLSVVEENGQAVVDLQDHVIDAADLEKAAYEFVLNSRSAGEMHETIGVGKLVESMVFTKDKQDALGLDLGKIGWWVGFQVEPDVFAKVKSGDLRAFSIGGRGVLEDMAEAA